MKITHMIGKLTFVLIGILLLANACSYDKNPDDYLKTVLNNLEQIESASYYTTTEGWAPGDTSAFAIYNRYVKEFNNTLDTTIGASFVELLQDDTTQMKLCYDGIMRALVREDDKKIILDSFNVRKLPFRPIIPPFFNYTKSIIKYALETKDSISMVFEECGDTLHLSLSIFEDKQIEFFGKPYLMDNKYTFDNNDSKYDIWINKSNGLPFKLRREMFHDISVRTCRDVELNKMNREDFKASDYFQTDFSIQTYRSGKRSWSKGLEGKVAPDWVLKNANNKTFALKDMKSKALMIQFTSVSCGPCRASVPFLNKLDSEYIKEDFDFVAIEGFSSNSNVLKSYQNRSDINYTFLMSTKDVTKSYEVKSVPVFFILDENRVIRKVIRGYGEGSTDKKIRDAINELI